MNLLSELKKWLSKPGNTKAVLASELNYKGDSTIAKWLSRKSIPYHKQAEVRRAIGMQSEEVSK